MGRRFTAACLVSYLFICPPLLNGKLEDVQTQADDLVVVVVVCLCLFKEMTSVGMISRGFNCT